MDEVAPNCSERGVVANSLSGPRWTLEQVLNGFCYLLRFEWSTNDFHFSAVARHEDTCRKPTFKTKLARELIVPKQDGEIDGHRGPIDVELFRLHVGFHRFFALIVHSYGHDGESF